MNKNYIKYELFRMRRKFNPLSLFYKNNELTYEQFKEYFDEKSVDAPDILYYNRVKQRFLEKQKEESKIIEIPLENVELQKESVKDKPVKKEKPKKRKAKKNESN